MIVLGINTSPRKNGNTQTLVQAVLDGAKADGAETRLVNLREMAVNGCLGCEGCKKHLGRCVQKDDLTPLLQEMTGVDAIVMGTPVYWFHVSAQFKALVDRLYCYMGTRPDPVSGAETMYFEFPAGKRFVLVVSRGDGQPPQLFPQFYDHLDEWLHLVPLSLNAGRYEFLHQYGAELDRSAAKKDPDLIERARAMGRGLVNP